MDSPKPTNTTRIIRDAFIDMALYLECLFLLHGVNEILVEDIIHCVEEGYTKTMKNLRNIEIPKPKIKRKTAVDRFLKKLEQDGI
ncbi:MAG TPA: hypothetical protein PLB95_10210 [Syntrophales bacterium]|nr:hypothetical protein [Syntrophales bacterium]HPX82256.1 hypothetical protein [Syntrophales bacterium]